jgi:predicted nucleic acid-binding protein
VIVVDTSIWVALLQGKPTPLDDVLGEGRVALHPFVLGELLLNGLPKNGPFSQESLENYAQVPVASSIEVASFIQWARLAGTGVGYVDAHLLVATRLLAKGVIMTLDTDLFAQAKRFDIAYTLT